MKTLIKIEMEFEYPPTFKDVVDYLILETAKDIV